MADFYNTVMEFVNDSSKESLRILLDQEFAEFWMIILHTLFKAENNNLDILLTVMAEHMNSAELVKLSVSVVRRRRTPPRRVIFIRRRRREFSAA